MNLSRHEMTASGNDGKVSIRPIKKGLRDIDDIEGVRYEGRWGCGHFECVEKRPFTERITNVRTFQNLLCIRMPTSTNLS